jgi:hypothetical protein
MLRPHSSVVEHQLLIVGSREFDSRLGSLIIYIYFKVRLKKGTIFIYRERGRERGKFVSNGFVSNLLIYCVIFIAFMPEPLKPTRTR